MSQRYNKLSSEQLFPIINTAQDNLFYNDEAYFVIENRYVQSVLGLQETTLEKAFLYDFYAKRISILGTKCHKKISADAQWLLNYLKKGKKLRDDKLPFMPLLASKKLRKRLYITETILLEGKSCNTIENLELVVRQFDILHKINSIGNIWNLEMMEFNSMVNKHHFLKKVTQNAHEILTAYDNGIKAIEKLIEEMGLL